MKNATSTGVGKKYCLQLEFLSQKTLMNPIDLAVGIEQVGNYLRDEGLLDGSQEAGDIIEAVRNISKRDFARIVKKHKPDYKESARLSLVDLSESGGAVFSHALSEQYQL